MGDSLVAGLFGKVFVRRLPCPQQVLALLKDFSLELLEFIYSNPTKSLLCTRRHHYAAANINAANINAATQAIACRREPQDTWHDGHRLCRCRCHPHCETQ